MKFVRYVAACALLLAALTPGYGRASDPVHRLPQPPRAAGTSADATPRWIPKPPPAAPLPDATVVPTSVTIPLPAEPTASTMPTEPPEPPEPLASSGITLAELEQIALSNNPTLVQASMQIQAAEGKRLQAGLYPNPTFGYEADEMGLGGSAGQQGAFVAQQIVTAGKRRLQRAVAGHQVTRTEHAWQAQQRRVINDVRSASFQVAVAQRIVQLNEQLVWTSEQGVSAASDLLAAKEVSRVDLLQARIEADSAKLHLQDARNGHLAAWRRLATLLGVPDMEAAVLQGDLEEEIPELNWDDAVQRLLDESPQMAAAHAGVEQARCDVARQRAEWVPNVDVRAGVRYHDAASDSVATLEVGLPLPIFDRNQGNICRAQAQLVASHNEVQRVELTLRNRLAAEFQRYANARHQARRYAAEILPNARQSLELVRSGYREGEFDYLTLLTAQRTYFQTHLAYLESLLELRQSSVLIEGFLLTGGLQQATRADR